MPIRRLSLPGPAPGARLTRMGFDVVAASPEAFRAFQAAEVKR